MGFTGKDGPTLERDNVRDRDTRTQDRRQRYQRRYDDPRPEIVKQPKVSPIKQVVAAARKVGQAIDRMFPRMESKDDMAYKIVRVTPRLLVVCGVLLLLCVILSRFPILPIGFLWAIPALGVAGVGIGMWAWTSNMTIRPGLSDEARAALKQSMRLQWGLLGMSVLALCYFVGMILTIW
ncbi:MAG: hypothetical protein HC837_01935 [Chloroflexaceae bacterium]|nr:hypothetical protein [Chloroflexaceae bacterium]